MLSDQKIGLALGILLIGATLAFFFRPEADPLSELPPLRSTQAMDQQISQRDRTPYLSETDPQRPVQPTPLENLDPAAGDAALAGVLVPDPIPSHNVAAELGASVETVSESWSPVTHTVQRGDTLSSIASKYLGSSLRFDEIFEANRDLLRDANDLRTGMELRIPPRERDRIVDRPGTRLDRGTEASPQSRNEGADASGAVPMPHDGEPDLVRTARPAPPQWEAHRGSPLVPRGAATPTPIAPPGGRRLTQVPPEDTVIRR
jgi:hypothetical protein